MLDYIKVEKFCYGRVSLKCGAVIVSLLCLLIAIGGPYAFRLGGAWSMVEIILAVAGACSAIMCFYGILRNKSSFLSYFVVVWMTDILYGLMSLSLVAFSYKSTALIYGLNIIVYIGCIFYCISVINGYRLQLKAEQKTIDPEMPTMMTSSKMQS